jgi:hypothetical protein
MAKQLIQLTQRQLQNDKDKSFADGIRRGRISALHTMLEQTEPDIAFEAVKQFIDAASWQVAAYKRNKNVAAKG